MQIVCPNCTTAYDVPAAHLGASGRSVRCARCRTVWFATAAPEPVKAAVPAVGSREMVASDPAPVKDAVAEEGREGGEFDWSFATSATDEDTDALEAGKAAEPAGAANEPSQDAVDAAWAEAEVAPIDQAPSLVPAMLPDPDPQATAEPENIETVAARRAPKAKTKRQWKIKWPRPGMAAAALVLAAILGGLVVWRAKVVQAAPQTASLFSAIGLPVNLRGLVFENVRTTGEVHEGVPVLIVEGTIANVTDRTVEVPRLRFAMRNRGGQEIYAWTSVTGRSILAPGETATFRTRLASPPAEGREVIVRFFHRRDFLAGMR